MTSYARAVGNMQTGGEDIRPLSAEEALRWLEENDFPEAAEKYFPEKIKDA